MAKRTSIAAGRVWPIADLLADAPSMQIASAECAMLEFAHLRAWIKRSMGAKRIWIAAGPLVLRADSVKYVLQVQTVCRGYATLACVRLFPPAPMALKMAGKPILIAEEWIAYRAALGARALLVQIAQAFLACKTFVQHPIVQTAFRMAAKSPLIADRHVRRVVQQGHIARCRKIARAKNAKVLRAI